MGKFEVDIDGNYVIIRDGKKLLDKDKLLVNKRGYLVDKKGNVVNREGIIVFRAQELDKNGEIPAPYLFEGDESSGSDSSDGDDAMDSMAVMKSGRQKSQ